MKELSIEQKAKAYDEAKSRISRAYNSNRCTIGFMNEIFPEFEESEDERIRGEMISYFKQINYDNAHTWNGINLNKFVAWLEKQGKETRWKPSKEEMDVLYGLAYISNQYDEHKEEVITRLYQDLKLEFFNGSSYENMFPTNTSKEDDVRRRSTIQVLEYARSLDTYNQYGKADIDKNIAWLEKQSEQKSTNNQFTPEQASILDKHIDKFLEQNHAWSEDDERTYRGLHNLIYSTPYCNSRKKLSDFLKSLKDRVQPKQEWSEEDEKMRLVVLQDLQNIKDYFPKVNVEPEFNWLKSLRPQPKQEWGEEDEKMWKSALWHVKNSCGNGGKNSGEFEVYNWLKSIKNYLNKVV